MEVRGATVADVPALAAALARAYADDPLMTWIVPRAGGRVERLEGFFAAGLARMVGSAARLVLTTPDRAGTATWAPPGRAGVSVRGMLPGVPAMRRAIGIDGLIRAGRAYGRLRRHHPSEPHWFLEGIGTDPAHQGRGVATALMRAVLDRCDAEGIAAYLETQNPANVGFYERRGFRVTGEVALPAGGPMMHLMLRRPAKTTRR